MSGQPAQPVDQVAPTIYVGIDPGVNGGIAVINNLGRVVQATKMPATNKELLELFRGLSKYWRLAMLERARPSRIMGVTNAFSYGLDYGAIQMGLLAAGIYYVEVVPRVWMTSMECLTKGDKNISKARAQDLFPAVKVTHAIADALLIASYCRKLHLRKG